MTSSKKGKNDMNDGVAMLLERMKTNPEEFVDSMYNGESKWGRLMTEYRNYLPKEDLEAFDAGHREAIFRHMQQRFTEKVMEELIDPQKSKIQRLREAQAKVAHEQMKSLRYPAVELEPHLDAHRLALGQTPIAGVTRTL